MIIRGATSQDLPAIAAIQSAAPEASQWDPREYLAYECRVAIHLGAVAGFVVTRSVGEGEREILNLAVAPADRRKGVGRQLLGDMLARHPGAFFLEVRESNEAARRFYEHLGFQVVTKRVQYYSNPNEPAIVMKLYSC
jgi:ribosomal-protein-alanine acetyltransferase